MEAWFQSTLPRGERQTEAVALEAVKRFNPRSRVGSDDIWMLTVQAAISFNPRSRVGSDVSANEAQDEDNLFQSTLPRGERPEILYGGAAGGGFQSTLPRGERLGGAFLRPAYSSFNPRSRVGSDARAFR